MHDELLDLEHRGWTSLCDGTGAEFYGEIMTEDGQMLLAHGQALDRTEVIASLGDAPPWQSYDISDVRAAALSDDAAILTYRGTGFRDEGEPFRALMSSVYTRRGGEWRLALYQQTPIPG